MFDRPGAPKFEKEEVKKEEKHPLKTLLYAESPERERNTLSHLTGAFWPCLPEPRLHWEDHFGVMEKGAAGVGGRRKSCLREKGESKREAWSHGQVGRLDRDWFSLGFFCLSVLFVLEVVE